jgi:polysaccharide chain length determinant protein (PEP-CTERM system associated)
MVMQYWKTKILSHLSSILLYRWYGVGVAWALCLAGWAIIAAMPDEYRAEAKVYIDTDNLMDPLLKGLTISIDPAQEIAIMLKTLITRPTLEQVIHLTDPKAGALGAAEMATRVENLQSKISIRGTETRNYYSIGFSDNSAEYATSVTQTLLSILQDTRVGSTRLDMDAARAFINKQLTDYEQRIRDADKRRADFRTQHIDILGKGAPANRIDQASQAQDTANRELNAAIARRDSLKAQIEATAKTVAMDDRMFPGANNAAPGVTADAQGRPVILGNASQRLEQARAQLDDLRTRFTENYPDVIRMKELIARLEAQLTPTTDSAHSVMVANPVYVQLLDKLSNEETNVAALRQRLSAASADRVRAKAEASTAIDIQAQFDGLDRDYGNVEAMYKQLLQSREAASLSQARDDQNQGVSFRVLEPPQKPEAPSSPNRLILNSLVLLMGLGGGIGIAALPSLVAGQILSSDELANQFGVPVMGVISVLPYNLAMRNGKLSTIALAASLILLFVSYVSVVALLQTSIYSVLGV